MKPILTLLVIFSFVSCSKYEQGPNFTLASKRSRMINTWQITKIETSNSVQYFSEGERVFTFYRNDDFSLQYDLQGYSYSEFGSWALADEKEYLDIVVSDWYGGEYWYSFKIIKLKSNELILKTQDDEYWTLRTY